MKGDFTRDTFDPNKYFTRVLKQQGRVELDADSNEQAAILLHYLQALAADLIGPHGGPADITEIDDREQEHTIQVNCGFEMIATKDRIQELPESDEKKAALTELFDESEPQLLVGKGRYYVDGILCENPDYVAFAAQPGYPFPDEPKDFNRNQSYLLYLDVWERHLTYLEMEDMEGSVISIRESALNGPDTATRAQLVWQLKAIDRIGDVDIPGELPRGKTWQQWVDENWPNDWRSQWQAVNRGRLKARASQSNSAPDDACIIPPDSHYRGAENQLYRVEIHNSGMAGNGATFKWSRENGSVIFPIRNISGNMVTLYSLGRDMRFGLQPDEWVEIVDDDYTLQNQAMPLWQVDTINYDDCVVSLKGNVDSGVGGDPTKHPILRRWDQRATENVELIADGVQEVMESTSEWMDLEDGVQIQFQPGGMYHAGDYWLIPVRTATGDVEWPGPTDSPKACPPRGVEHHYAPIWIIKTSGGSIGLHPEGDLRRKFAQLWMLKPE